VPVPPLRLKSLTSSSTPGKGAGGEGGGAPAAGRAEEGPEAGAALGPDLFSPLTSPKMRRNTFAATLDLIEALCEVSSRLAQTPEGERKEDLETMLGEINEALESPEAAGSACLYPLSAANQQILRIPPQEAILLSSKERAPFMLFIEVLEEEPSAQQATSHALAEGREAMGEGAAEHPGAGSNGLARWSYNPFTSFFSPSSPAPPAARAASEAGGAAADGVGRGSASSTPAEAAITSKAESKVEAGGGPESEAEPEAEPVAEEGSTRSLPDPLRDPMAAQTISEAIDTAMASLHVGEELKTKVVSPKRPGATSVEGASATPEGEEEVVRAKGRMVGAGLRGMAGRRRHSRVPSMEALTAMAARYKLPQPDLGSLQEQIESDRDRSPSVSEEAEARHQKACAVYGESFEEKRRRLKKSSPYGRLPTWKLQSVVVKAGDDCRQELMAVQLVKEFNQIFAMAGLPMNVREYGVIVTSSHSGLIETVLDAVSIHGMKKGSFPGTSLRQHFEDRFGGPHSGGFLRAQRNFVESMAAYSILCYLLQVKDRHNSNILIDQEGHLIHIDFGFMLSNSPGGINFETAPFKLTRELLEVMNSDAEGKPSQLFDYFRVLLIQGFLACRKHSERIVKLIEIMHTSAFPCFRAGPRALANLKARFHLASTEEQCVQLVLDLVNESLDAWRTRQYDYYQRILNGIL